MYVGDFRLGTTFDVKFTTRRFSTGAPFTLAGSPVISVYENNGTTQATAGITLTVDFDGVTGLNNVRVVVNTAGLSSGANHALVITTGTVDGVSVVGEVVANFSVENRSALMPTAGARTLDVSAGGEAGLDWANVGSPTSTVGLSGTTVKTATDVATATTDIQARLPAALSSGNMKVDVLALSGDTTAADNAEAFFDGTGYAGTNNVIPTVTTTATATAVTTVNGLAAGVITATSIAADAITAAKVADGTIDAATFATGAITAAAIAADAIGASELAADAVTEIQSGLATAAALTTVDDFLDTEIAAIIATLGSAGAGLTAVPWNAAWDAEVQSEATDALNAYDPPTNTEMEARTIAAASYATASALDAVDNFLDTEVAAILADTNELQTDWADGGRLDLLLDGASSAGDPWGTALPGGYTAGQAGKIIGDNINATISSRSTLTAAQANTEVDTALSDVGLTTTITGRIDAAVTTRASQTSVNTIDDFLDTEIAAIKAKTDLIPGTIDGKTFSELVTLIAAVLLGKASGLETSTAVYRAVDDSKDRVTGTVDSSGNRSAIVLDAA
jgi:hypothetical protein